MVMLLAMSTAESWQMRLKKALKAKTKRRTVGRRERGKFYHRFK
jgi:hypothetical protein